MYVYMYMYIYTNMNIVSSCLPLHCVKYVYVYISIGKCTYCNDYSEWWSARDSAPYASRVCISL